MVKEESVRCKPVDGELLVTECGQKNKTEIYINKRRSRTAIFSVNVADKKLVEQTTNHFCKWAKIDQKSLDGDLVERIQADYFRE